MDKCPKCSSDKINTGALYSTSGSITYKAAKHKNPFTAGKLSSHLCLDCGYIEAFVDKAYCEKVAGWQT